MNSEDSELCSSIRDDFYSMGFGNTPMLVHHMSNGSTIYAKLEFFNPFGSIKDRGSFFMIEDAIKKSDRNKKLIIVDGSSGNTGIAIGNICRKLGLESIIFIPPGIAKETREKLEQSGAQIEVVGETPESTSTAMAIERANKLALEKPESYRFLHQHGNPMNYKAHIYTTGPEALQQIGGTPNYVAIAMGTGGSIIGNGLFFKRRNQDTDVIMMQSNQDAYIQGIRNFMKAKDKVILEKHISIVDRMLNLSEKDAENGVKFLIENYELLVGFSAGGNFSGAMKIGEEHPGSSVYTVFPDSGDKYRNLYLSRKLTTDDDFVSLSKKILDVRKDYVTL